MFPLCRQSGLVFLFSVDPLSAEAAYEMTSGKKTGETNSRRRRCAKGKKIRKEGNSLFAFRL